MVYTQVIALALAFSSLASALPGAVIADNPDYRYSYGVNDGVTGDRKTQSEVRSGDVVKGSYSFVQPDGITRTVNYIADPINGFRAQVLNDGVDVTGGQVIAAAPAAIVSAAPAVVAAAPAAVDNTPVLIIPPGQETPEVAALRAAHLQAHVEARARNGIITVAASAPIVAAAPAPVILAAGPSPVQDTPEVAAARIAHLKAVAAARARNAAVAVSAPIIVTSPFTNLGLSGPISYIRNTGPLTGPVNFDGHILSPAGFGLKGYQG